MSAHARVSLVDGGAAPRYEVGMGQILDGKLISQRVRDEVKADVDAFVRAYGRPPGLTVVLVGDDPASVIYTRNKEKQAREIGMRSALVKLGIDAREADVLAVIRKLNDDAAVDGILVQLPLPKHMREHAVIEAIDPKKDVDGFHPENVGRLAIGAPRFVPCTPLGAMRLIRETNVDIAGARAVVIGRSNIVGKPMAQLLLAEHATVTVAHSKTRDLRAVCRDADVLVVAVGRAQLVRGDWVKPGAVVIDVGINRRDDGSIVGDVAFAEVVEHAAWTTPVPGGVGPMTIACLLANTVRAAKLRCSRA